MRLPEKQLAALKAAAVAPLTRRRHGWANEGHSGFATNTVMSLGDKGLLDVVDPYKTGTATITEAGLGALAAAAPKLPAHVETEIAVALAFVRDGGLRSAASVLRNLARWLERGAAAREFAVGVQFAEVTPFLKAYPTPWRLADREVVDRDGCNVQDFDDDPDTVEFWRCVVDAVNAWAADPINLQGSGPAPIEPREG